MHSVGITVGLVCAGTLLAIVVCCICLAVWRFKKTATKKANVETRCTGMKNTMSAHHDYSNSINNVDHILLKNYFIP